jgi:hypothetical protein
MYVMTLFELIKIAPDERVTSVAATGPPKNGIPVAAAQFKSGYGLSAMAVDAEGNIYIADAGNFQLRRIGIDGLVHTFAGTGLFRQEGENWPAAVSFLNSPHIWPSARKGRSTSSIATTARSARSELMD